MTSKKMIIAPYVRECLLDNLEDRIKVSNTAHDYCKNIEHLNISNHVGACVALSLYRYNLETKQRLLKISEMSGLTYNGLISKVSQIRKSLTFQDSPSFQQLVTECNLPLHFVNDSQQIYEEIKDMFPNSKLDHPATYASIIVIIADVEGIERQPILNILSRITSTEITEILSSEILVRTLLREKNGSLKKRKKKKKRECSEDVKTLAKQEIEEISKSNNQKKKKVQTLLNFPVIPRKDV